MATADYREDFALPIRTAFANGASGTTSETGGSSRSGKPKNRRNRGRQIWQVRKLPRCALKSKTCAPNSKPRAKPHRRGLREMTDAIGEGLDGLADKAKGYIDRRLKELEMSFWSGLQDRSNALNGRIDSDTNISTTSSESCTTI